MDEPRDHMTVLETVVVIRPKDVGGDDTGELAAILLVVGPGTQDHRIQSLTFS